ncbi:open rectifier potassium channel protein 1 [Ochlerotatus camptorhynchus]|uniref:open rectifier potassium channel protein 1 n=1 Tax=Ochlerotatus camptorhynchus TaxID=644619 RepID=UPI0031D5EC3F
MTPKEWLALFAFYAAYLFFGSSVFYHNEHALETERRAEKLAERIEMNELLTKYLAPHDHELQQELLVRISDYCNNKVTNYTLDEYVDPYVWNFYHSFYFAFIVCSTIGYGNISPNNTFGRIFMIFYALIGLPVNGFFFAYLGDLYSKTYIRLYRRYKQFKLSSNTQYVPHKVSFIGQIILYLIPGIVIFIFVPAVIFCYFEKWPYDVGVYYAFVTLTTIGFGDYTTTFQASQEHEFGAAFVYYQIFIILWFFSGVGYVFMILGFIAKGLAHKKVQRLEKILALNVKATQSRVWNGVTRDISYLRKILNEVYMLKFKPVFEEPSDRFASMNLSRSDSCPELSMYREEDVDPVEISRKRAFSMSMMATAELRQRTKSTVSIPSIRRLSDSDLSRINRTKTFGIHALVQPAELLAKVVSALANISTIDEDDHSILEHATLHTGINCFSDSQILASEQTWSGWSNNGSDKAYLTTPPLGRQRASSDIGLAPHQTPGNPYDWTWSGGDAVQIKEMMKIRQKALKSRDNLLRTALSNSKQQFGSNISVTTPPLRTERLASFSAMNRKLLQRLNPFRKTSTVSETKSSSIYDVEAGRPIETYLSNTSRGRASMFNFSQQQYLSTSSRGRGSMMSLPPSDEHLLETTTIGDLIRALEIAHTQAAMPNFVGNTPKRKLATSNPPQMPPSVMSIFANQPSRDAVSRRGSLKLPLGQSLSNPLQSSPHSHSPGSSSSYRPANPPPYNTASAYPTSPKPLRRRFSVRLSSLAYPPGQCPRSGTPLDTSSPLTSSTSSLHNPTTSLQRKLSNRPSPLASQNQNLLTVPSTVGGGSGSKSWRPALLRSDSDQTACFSPIQRITPSMIGTRCRHSSLCHNDDARTKDDSGNS